jgi:hypothetical protein
VKKFLIFVNIHVILDNSGQLRDDCIRIHHQSQVVVSQHRRGRGRRITSLRPACATQIDPISGGHYSEREEGKGTPN